MSKTTNQAPSNTHQEEIKQVKSRLARALADYRNLEARTSEEIKRQVQDQLARLADEVIMVYESVVKLSSHYPKDDNFKAVKSQFEAMFDRWQIKPVKVRVGDKFDPQTSQCLAVVAGPADQVVEVVRSGFTLAGKLLRPALVKVGNGKKLETHKGGQDG